MPLGGVPKISTDEKIIADMAEWRVLASNNMGINMGTVALTPGQMRAYPFKQSDRHKYTDFAVYVTAGARNNARLRLYIYDNNYMDKIPGKALIASPELLTNTNNLTYGFRPTGEFSLEPGVYWAVFHSDTSLTVRSLPWMNIRAVRGFGTPAAVTQVTRAEIAVPYTGLPINTWPAGAIQINGTNQNVPAMYTKSIVL